MKIDWNDCPYNFEAHKRIIREMDNGVIPYNHNNYLYHQSRIDRCWDWYYKNKKSQQIVCAINKPKIKIGTNDKEVKYTLKQLRGAWAAGKYSNMP